MKNEKVTPEDLKLALSQKGKWFWYQARKDYSTPAG